MTRISEDHIRSLKESRLFKAASDGVVQSLADVLEIVPVAAGERIITKGERGTDMFIVLDGRVRVHDGDLIFTHFGNGDAFGEVAALDAGVRTASVTAEIDSTLFRLDQLSMRDLLRNEPSAATAIIRMLCEREKSIIGDYTERAWKSRLMERELEIGRQIQAGFLPESMPEVAGWEIAARFHAARQVAGDFYDAFHVRALGRVALVIGDVCDKGVGAALFMTLFRSLVRAALLSDDFTLSQIKWGESESTAATEHSPGSRVRASLTQAIMLTNNYVAQTHAKSNMFASLFLGLLDPDSGSLVYVNAGHEAPCIFDPAGITRRLDPTGPVVGVFAGMEYGIEETRLGAGDALLAFTDGVTEAVDANGEQFSEDRLMPLLRPERSAPALLDGIVSSLEAFAAGVSQHDDITLLAVRRAARDGEVAG